jgi:hypothetical protein
LKSNGYLNTSLNTDNLLHWCPGIGTADHPFAGEFDGDDHTIEGLYINKPADNRGLFTCAEGAYIHNVIFQNFFVSGYYRNNIGVLVGKVGDSNLNTAGATTRIENVTLKGAGTVFGYEDVGGLVGAAKDLQMKNCHNLSSTAAVNNSANGIGVAFDLQNGGVRN